MTTYGNSTEQDEFQSELMYNMLTLQNNLELIEDKNDRKFAKSLCDWYDRYGQLSVKQTYKAMQFWQQVNSLGAKQSNPSREGG